MMKRKIAMLRRYDQFVSRMDDHYAQARACLARDDYVGAQAILAAMTVSHARTTLSLRNVLVKDGMLEEDK